MTRLLIAVAFFVGLLVGYLGHMGTSCVKTPDGKWLGVKPAEFEWVCPYGAIGDRIRVLEEWHNQGAEPLIRYRASGDDLHPLKQWNPAASMPAWASRYFLKIVDVAAQKVGTDWTWVLSVQLNG